MTSSEVPADSSSAPPSSGELPSFTRSRSRRRRRPSSFRRLLARLWKGWGVEILIALALVLGLFLVFERMQIRQTLEGWLVQGVQTGRRIGGGVLQWLTDLVQGSSVADRVGFALVLLALILIAWRTRRRLLTSPRLSTLECPRCGSGLHRIHRRTLDRFLSLYLPVRRYRCRSETCDWQGLRTGRRSGD